MASAIKPDTLLHVRSAFPVDNSDGPGAFQRRYGLGKVSALTSVLNRNRAQGWVNGSSVARVGEGQYAFRDIIVPEGASRLDLMMTWDEPPADTIGSAVLNDLDLWLDEGGDCSAGACGEFVSRSRRDNVEWVIVHDPAWGIRNPGALAFHEISEALYLASEMGLQTFSRNPVTGDLSFEQLLEGDYRRSALLWDSHRNRLIATADRCRTSAFDTFAVASDNSARLSKGADLKLIDVDTSARSCDATTLFVGPDGFFLYLILEDGISAFAFDATGESIRGIQVEKLFAIPIDAVVGNQGTHLYAVAGPRLFAFERSAESGLLTETFDEYSFSWGNAIAVSDDDAYLFTLNDESRESFVFGLENPSRPVELQSKRIRDDYLGVQKCAVAMGYRIPAVDGMCRGWVFGLQWLESAGDLILTNSAVAGSLDRFGNLLPEFDDPNGMAASPDGRHLYFSTDDQGILIFERVGNEISIGNDA